MTQQNIAYKWNIINKSTLTHALLLVVLDRVYRPVDRIYQNRVYLHRVHLDRLYFATEFTYTPFSR